MGIDTIKGSKPGKDWSFEGIGVVRSFEPWGGVDTVVRVHIDDSCISV